MIDIDEIISNCLKVFDSYEDYLKWLLLGLIGIVAWVLARWLL